MSSNNLSISMNGESITSPGNQAWSPPMLNKSKRNLISSCNFPYCHLCLFNLHHLSPSQLLRWREKHDLSQVFSFSVWPNPPNSMLPLTPPMLVLLYYPSHLRVLPQVLFQCVSVHVVPEMGKLNISLQTQFYKCKMKNKQTNWIASLYLLAEILLVPSQMCLIFTLRVCFWLVVLQVFSENHLPNHLNSAVLLPGTSPFKMEDFILWWASGDSC